MEPTILKPNKSAFVSFRIGALLILSLIALAVLLFVLPVLLLIGIPFFVLLNIVYYWSLSVQFKKAFYEFHGNRIVAKGGDILSNYQTELIVRNITHVTVSRPFIRHKLFGTGNVKIESAGSGNVEVFLHSIVRPLEVYASVQELMQANGFSLQKKELVQHEKPALLGVFFEVFGYLIGVIFLFVWIRFGVIVPLAESGVNPALFASFLWILVIIGAMIVLALKYLDLINRDYWIYEDAIVYDEGFLTKHDSFIPIENISDSTLTQGLFEKIFSLYDIKVSCQGSSQEIKFKNIRNGELMEKNIDSFIEKSQGFSKTVSVKQTTQPHLTGFAGAVSLPETAFTGAYQMNLKRAVAPIFLMVVAALIGSLIAGFIFEIPLPIAFGSVLIFSIVIGLIAIIVTSIIATQTNYFVNKKSIAEKFNFVIKKNVEFSNEKITGVTFKQNFIDDWLGTFSIDFWSIGSSVDISFKHLVKSDDLVQSVKEKFGVLDSQLLYETRSKFSLGAWIKAWLPLVLIGLLGLVVLLLLNLWIFAVPALVGLGLILIYLGFYYKTSKIHFYKDFVSFEKGIFFKYKYYSLYDNIKDIATTKYPLSSLGTIKFNVAGEKIVKTKNGQSISPHGFRMNYMEDISNKDELIDLIFFKRPSAQEVQKMLQDISAYSEKPILSVKPRLANSMLVTLVVLVLSMFVTIAIPVIMFLLLPAFAVIIIWVFLYVKAKTYFIQSYRVVMKSGVVYKSQKSVVYSKIDHINKSQGALNKMFHNGTVVVNTTGSSMPELVLTDMSKYAEFYEELKKHY